MVHHHFLDSQLRHLADPQNCLFTSANLGVFFPDLSLAAIKMVLARAVKYKILIQFAHGLYLYPVQGLEYGKLLYMGIHKLRPGSLNYLSLETVLSQAGIISQVPFNWITVTTTGRSGILDCRQFGKIEFIHTSRKLKDISVHLTWDDHLKVLRADNHLALLEMRRCGRSTLDLVMEEDDDAI